MKFIQDFFTALNGVIWGPPMLIFLLFTGIKFTLKSNFFQIKGINHILTSFKNSFKKTDNGISQFSVFCSVLGACIGTGNIVGVATAIYSGGPGTVFWMIISALISSMTAYSENYLGALYSNRYKYKNIVGGAFLYIENGLEMKGLAKIYAFLCLLSALGMGNMTQSNSLAKALEIGFDIPLFHTGLFVFVICLILISGGFKRLANAQAFIVPVATAFYFFISAIVLIKFKSNILPCLHLIFKQAFSFKAFKGYSVYTAMRYGISRGVFSNEAGLGSSTILHSQGNNENPEAQGMLAILEVIIDTVIMCSITALVILVSTDIYKTKLFGAELSVKAYGTIGNIGKSGITVLTSIFGFTSLVSCSFYAEKSFIYLFTNKHIKLFKVIYCLISFIACVNSPKVIWQIADICNGLMAIPNLFALNCLQKEIEYPESFKNKHPHHRVHSSFRAQYLQ